MQVIEDSKAEANFQPSGADASLAFRYVPRRVKPRPVCSVNGYRLKPYEIYYAEDGKVRLAEPELKSLISRILPVSDDPLDHGVGFVMVHFARDGQYLLLSRWYGGNMLKHDLFEITQAAEGWQSTSLRSTGIVACVWELQIMTFERQAWVTTAMAEGGTESSLNRYLNTVLEGWI
jgi:hypothetical protein